MTSDLHTTPALPRLGRIVRGSGPGLLLAHGAGGGVDANFGPVLDTLAAHHTVVGPDFPGTGRTPRATTPLTLDGLADAVVGAAVEEGLETFAIAGYSLGTAVAVRAATRHPGRVTALALTAGFAYPNPRLLLATRLWRDILRTGTPDQLAAFVALVGLGTPALEALSAADLDTALTAAATTVPPGTLDHLDLLLSPDLDVRPDLPALAAVPTLVISTTLDQLVTPSHHTALAAAIPGAHLAELPTGHLPFAEQPTTWAALLTAFLSTTHG